jgi:hypothetical protein
MKKKYYTNKLSIGAASKSYLKNDFLVYADVVAGMRGLLSGGDMETWFWLEVQQVSERLYDINLVCMSSSAHVAENAASFALMRFASALVARSAA